MSLYERTYGQYATHLGSKIYTLDTLLSSVGLFERVYFLYPPKSRYEGQDAFHSPIFHPPGC